MNYFDFKNKSGLLGGGGYSDMGQNDFWGEQAAQMGQQYDPYFGDVGMDVNQGQQVQNPIQPASPMSDAEKELERLKALYRAEAEEAKRGESRGIHAMGKANAAPMGKARDMSQYANLQGIMNMVKSSKGGQLPFQNFM